MRTRPSSGTRGDAFAADADLLEPGEREVRNPRIVLAFRRIGLSEHAGWGLRDVFRNWQQLGNVPPWITNDKRRKSFELVLKKEALLSEQQLLLQAQLGVRLTDDQARTFAFACHQHNVTLSQIKAGPVFPAGKRSRSQTSCSSRCYWNALASDGTSEPDTCENGLPEPIPAAIRLEPLPTWSLIVTTPRLRSCPRQAAAEHRRSHPATRRNF